MMFGHRQLLWLLLVIPPAMGVFFWWARRKREALRQQFIQARLLPALTVGISPMRQKIRHGCLIAAAVCIILALARPQWGYDFEEAHQRGLDIVVAVDTSKSMLAEDIAPNRLSRAKLAALDLMRQAKSDRLGLVAFAGSAFLQCPLTIDDSAFRQSVNALDVNLIPQGGTAIADAIKTALTAFKETDNYKVLVLFTDGEDQDSGALDEAKKAAEAGLQIFTIGIGSTDGELLRISDAKGRTDYIRDDQGNVVKSRLNESLLREIAGAAKGFYLPLRGATTIESLYEKGLAPLPKSESSEKIIKTPHERYQWPLGFAIVLLIAEAFFPERKRQTKQVETLSRKTSLAAAAMLTMLLILPAAHASPSSALREYKAGEYDKAFEEYQQLLKSKKPDPRLHFNAGAAAYRQEKFDEAAKHFEESMAASPDLKLQEQAYYNRGNALFHMGEGLPDPAKRTETWKKSLQDFESTLKLNPQDADAKYNAAFVKKKLEELQQQQQQNQQNKDDKQNQDQKDQKDQQKNDQSKKDQDQQNQEQQKQNQQNQSQDKRQQDQQKQEQEKQEQEKQQQASKPEEKKQDEKASAKPGEKSDDKQDAQQAYAAGQMTPEDAQRLLDSQKGDERMLPVSPENKPSDQTRHIRDW